MKKRKISDAVIRRLPRYYRYLDDLHSKGIVRISSNSLGERMGITASQIRQDLSCFGEFGQQGYGYNILELRTEIGHILGVDEGHRLVVVGAGHLGQALLSYGEFAHYGLKIAAAFDSNPDLQGSSIHGCPVYGMDMLPIVCQQNNIPIGIITTPAQYAQDVCDQLVAAGCKAIWNFAHVHLYVPEGTLVQNEDMAVSFALLSNRLAKTMRTDPEEA